MTIADIGETGLIKQIQKIIGSTVSPEVIIPIGDDSAALKTSNDVYQLLTCDIQIEDSHFRLDWISPYQLGRRAMSVNLSDIAAMGGEPKYALISLGLPKNLDLDFFNELYRGFRDQGDETATQIIGGNLAHTDEKIIIDIFLIGEVKSTQLMTRKGARPGDRIYISGLVGSGFGGYLALKQFDKEFTTELSDLVEAYLQPKPRLEAGRSAAKSGYCTALIDVSDGLSTDIHHLCSSSGVGAELYQLNIPISENLSIIADIVHSEIHELALHGGEDYELLFTMRQDTPQDVIDEIAVESGITLTEIGRILHKSNDIKVVDLNGKRELLQPSGWDHFL